MSTSRATRLSTVVSDRPQKRLKPSEDKSATSSTESSTVESSSMTSQPGPGTPPPEPTEHSAPISDPVAQIRKPSWMAEDVLQRLHDFLTFSEHSTNRFAVSKVPALATWGDSPNTARYLCFAKKPVTVWLVGTVESKWFQTHNGDPQDTVNIGIRPLREVDHNAAIGLLSRSHPRKVPTITTFYARRRMTEWTAGALKPSVRMFERIYDATNGFGRKSTLPQMYPADIANGDIVLVEAALIRYKTGNVKTRWESWNVSFELQSVCILAQGPRDEQETPAFFGDESDATLLDDSSLTSIVAAMDFPTLLSFRDFFALLEDVADDADMLVIVMEELGVHIGGLSTLSFFLRLPPSLDYPLQFYVPNDNYHPFLTHLRTVQQARTIARSSAGGRLWGFRSVTFMKGPRRKLAVFRSTDRSSLTPLVRTPTTAAMCYLGPSHMGVMWPSLTFDHRALLGDIHSEKKKKSIADDLNFSTKLYAWMWSDLDLPAQQCSTAAHAVDRVSPRPLHYLNRPIALN
ncbi:hypothetical protein FKP32DRAFT_1605164 [Trametes sanguinea]|nr:hypothetical protein FKP32DRAFT_1605164 [Trametes sanguinea]